MFDIFTLASRISWSHSELASADVWCVIHLVLSVVQLVRVHAHACLVFIGAHVSDDGACFGSGLP